MSAHDTGSLVDSDTAFPCVSFFPVSAVFDYLSVGVGGAGSVDSV